MLAATLSVFAPCPRKSVTIVTTMALLVAAVTVEPARADPPQTNKSQEKKFVNEVTGECRARLAELDR